MPMRGFRLFLLLVSALGTLVFGGILVLAVVHPLAIEKASREILRMEIERRTATRIDELSGTALARMAAQAARQTRADIDATREAIRADVPARVARVMADMMNVDCECRRKMVERSERFHREKLASLVQLRERLDGFIESAYADVRDHLLREIIIVSAGNALAFIALGAVVLARPAARLQLALVAAVLLGAVTLTSAGYLFGQNWIHAILFSDYVGLGYLAYLAAAVALLADIAFNRARVTSRILNAVAHAVGSSVQAVPC